VLLSVIIPTYNRATLVERTLHSLACQSTDDFRVILVDHGSTDNTREICQSYLHTLRLDYYKIPRAEYFAAGVPRDFGARKAETPLLLFLDAGMIVPSWYIAAHLEFHRSHGNYVGVGMQHGQRAIKQQREQEGTDSVEDLSSLLTRIDIDRAYPVLQEAQLLDQREKIHLEASNFPWFFGMTANLSLSREAYVAAGGFDLDFKGWGFEDLDLCYRLYKQGLKFSFVRDGWGIELPQLRAPLQERLKSNEKNLRYSFSKHRSLALEALIFAGLQYNKAEETFQYLTAIKQHCSGPSAIPETVRARFARPSLFIGGTAQDAEFYEYVALGDENFLSTTSLWSCSGIFLPLADRSLETVFVSDIWKKLNWSITYFLGLHSISLLECLISEIRRTAQKAVFLDTASALSDSADTPLDLLESICFKQKLPFQIIHL
jgi:glycosyltransferase involved in cell wall biosynthesis